MIGGKMMKKMKMKIILISMLVALISGITVAAFTMCIQNRKMITKKAKKAFKQLENKLEV